MAKDSPCILPDCPAWRRAVGCGYLAVGAPCGHPRMRERWRAAQAGANVPQGPGPRLASGDVVQNEPANFADSLLIRRAEAAQRPLSPARALQLALQLEETWSP